MDYVQCYYMEKASLARVSDQYSDDRYYRTVVIMLQPIRPNSYCVYWSPLSAQMNIMVEKDRKSRRDGGMHQGSDNCIYQISDCKITSLLSLKSGQCLMSTMGHESTLKVVCCEQQYELMRKSKCISTSEQYTNSLH